MFDYPTRLRSNNGELDPRRKNNYLIMYLRHSMVFMLKEFIPNIPLCYNDLNPCEFHMIHKACLNCAGLNGDVTSFKFFTR